MLCFWMARVLCERLSIVARPRVLCGCHKAMSQFGGVEVVYLPHRFIWSLWLAMLTTLIMPISAGEL